MVMILKLSKDMMKNKKALSGVISAIILIGLAMVLVAIVWGVVNGILKSKLDEAQSCFGIFEKVDLESKNMCFYNSTKELHIYVSVGDIDIDGMLISVMGNGTAKSFNIPGNYSYVRDYSGLYSEETTLPEKNSGLTYVFNATEGGIQDPSSVQVAPIVSEKQCDVSDSVSPVDKCL